MKTCKANTPQSQTVHAACEAWLAGNANNWKESTRCRYQEKLRVYILPIFGQRQLADITTDEIADFLMKIRTEGLPGRTPVAPGTASMILGIFSQLRRQALRNDYPVSYMPECIRIKKERPYSRVFSEQEQRILISELLKDMDAIKAGILLCLFTGIRIGELCALTGDDIELSRSVLHVRHTMQRLPIQRGGQKTTVIIGAPKSMHSLRDIPFSPHLAKMLLPFCHPGAFLLTGKGDVYIEPRSLSNRFFRILENCGLPRVNFHTLRHTFATRCIERGMDAKTLSELLGHASIAITMDRYVHLSMDYKAKKIELLSDLFTA